MDFKDLPAQYDHRAAQAKWYPFWEERGYFHANADDPRPPYSIVIPPPNVTGALHLGHALNNTLQDILIRMKRMQGFNVLWMPGTDHAGIATQAVVERRLFEEEKKTRHDLGREGLVKRIWDWKDQLRGPHPRPAPPARLQLRLAADPLHARRPMCASRPRVVLPPVQRWQNLSRQTARQLGHVFANRRQR